MVQLRGQGSMTGLQLLAVTFSNSVTTDGKTRYLDIQVNADDPKAAGQSNLHLMTRRGKDNAGKDVVNNGAPYSIGQFEKIKEAAGDNVVELPNGSTVYSFTGDVMPSRKTHPAPTADNPDRVVSDGLVVNTGTTDGRHSLGAGPKIDAEVVNKQFAHIAAVKDARTPEPQVEPEPEAAAPEPAKKTTRRSTRSKAASVEVSAPEVGEDEPQVG